MTELELLRLVIATVGQAIDAFRNAKSGVVTPEQAMAGLQQLHDQLAANNAAADQALHDKFDKTT